MISYFNQKRFRECIRVCQFLTEFQTANEVTYFYQAQSESQLKHYKSSNELFETCLSFAISKTAETYFYGLGQNFEKIGMPRKAIANYDTSYYLFRSPMMLYNIGRVYETALHNKRTADVYFRKFLRIGSENNSDERQIIMYIRRRFQNR